MVSSIDFILIFVTNIHLSGSELSGGLTSLTQIANNFRELSPKFSAQG